MAQSIPSQERVHHKVRDKSVIKRQPGPRRVKIFTQKSCCSPKHSTSQATPTYYIPNIPFLFSCFIRGRGPPPCGCSLEFVALDKGFYTVVCCLFAFFFFFVEDNIVVAVASRQKYSGTINLSLFKKKSSIIRVSF